MKARTAAFVVLIVASFVTGDVRAQRLTIPETVRQTPPGKSLNLSRTRDIWPQPFEQMAREAALILRATLTKRGTFLSEDAMELYTDYVATPIAMVAETPGRQGMQKGGIIVRQFGGETVVDGVTVRMADANFPLLPTGEPVLLFLTIDPKAQVYRVFGEGTGAFALEGGRRLRVLQSPGVPHYQRFEGMDVDAIVGEIHRLGR